MGGGVSLIESLCGSVRIDHPPDPKDRSRNESNKNEHQPDRYSVEDDEQDAFAELPIIELSQSHEKKERITASPGFLAGCVIFCLRKL